MWSLSKPIGTILVLLSMFLFRQPAQAKYGGGSGTAEDPYQIATAADLLLLGESPHDYDKQFILTMDIDLDPNLAGGKVFDKAVIGSFTGVFDGNAHTISHLTINGGRRLGLFAEMSGEVKDLGVLDVNITGSGDYVGGLAGSNRGNVMRCYSTGKVSGGSVGGLVGVNYYGTITSSYSTCTVTGGYCVGGLVGDNEFARITTSYSTGTVSGTGWSVGGLVGVNELGTITTSYSTGAVSGAFTSVGGLVGYNSWMSPGSVTSCFWDSQTSGQTTSAGGTGKSTAEMKTASTFLEAGWDFVNVWGIGENQTYPYLRKYSAADINQDASVNFLDLAALAERWLGQLAP